MAFRYGSLSVLDTLAKYNNTNVIAFGEEQMAGFLRTILAAYNAFVEEMLSEFVGTPPDRETSYGINTTSGDMVEVDEFGQADAQKIPFAPSSVGFPLRRVQYSLQWTQDYLAFISPLELANQVLGITEADERYFFNLLRRTLLKSTNNTAYVDRLGGDNRTLALRALVNADSQAMPPHPITGTSFNAATHTHYLATAALIEANALALIETVREHRELGTLRVAINSAQEAAWRAFASFKPYTDTRIIYSDAADRAAASTSQTDLEDRAIGFIGPAEVWVKPWMPASYAVCWVIGGTGEPVLGWRKPANAYAKYANLTIAAENDRFPLHSQTMQRMLGMSVWNRIGAAVLYSGSGTYANFTG